MTGALQEELTTRSSLVWAGIAVVGFLLFLSIWTSRNTVSWKFGATAVLAASMLVAIGLATGV